MPKLNKRAVAAKHGWSKRIRTADSSNLSAASCMNKENESVNIELASQQITKGVEENGVAKSDSSSGLENIEILLKSNPTWCKAVYKGPPKSTIVEEHQGDGVISSNEYDRIMEHEFNVEPSSEATPTISGNRIVELGYVLEKVLSIQAAHLKLCTLASIHFHKEIRRGTGLVSLIQLKCSTCDKIWSFNTENPDKEVINVGMVWGTLASGSSYLHTSEMLSCVDIPPMPQQLFSEYEEYLSDIWKQSLWAEIEDAGKIEKSYAIEKGNVCSDGTPWATVYIDGSWSKRSYGTNFNALSGMVGIIGKYTGQLLYISVRNKYCSICARAKTKSIDPGNHLCYKNWDGPTTAMEADMAVEGFCKSEEIHGIRYCKFIADGDSSVYAKIKQQVPYGSEVRKIECTNHALKNYGKHLRAIKKDTSINLAGRKLLTIPKIQKLTKRAKCSIYEHSNNGQNIALLKYDLENGFHHIYGDHSKCREDICNNVGDISNNKIPLLKSTLIYNHIKGTAELLARKAHLLVENENNNTAERLMNIIARFNMGKRVNFIQRGSYDTRVCLSGLRYNKLHDWSTLAWKRAFGCSPGKYFKKFIEEQNVKHSSKVKRRLFETTKKRRRGTENQPDLHYGLQAEQPELDRNTIIIECEKLLNDLQVSLDERNLIAFESVGQFGNRVYELEREKRLTASLFGRVINRRPYTPCHNIVKACLNKHNVFSLSLEYGITKERVAISLFEKKNVVTVQRSGFWVDLENGFLGASPDGLVGEDALVEVKCFYACSKLDVKTIQEVLDINKKTCLKKTADGCISLKRNHPYYYQVQGQLNICQRRTCYFVVYINDNIDIFVEEIERDEELWKNKMVPKLSRFYKECIAPEIMIGNLKKNKKCVDPPFILEAIQVYEKAKESKQAL